ncbi:MAG: hypothetical protein ACTSP3_15625 [Candidatus Heimdallarchaeaceae archaeon]
MNVMSVDLTERLKKYGKEMKDWEEMKTSVEGVSIVKMPSKGDDLNFGLKILPVNEEGKPLKRREKALFITSLEQWEAFKKIFNNKKGYDLILNIDSLRKDRAPQESNDESQEVFEI